MEHEEINSQIGSLKTQILETNSLVDNLEVRLQQLRELKEHQNEVLEHFHNYKNSRQQKNKFLYEGSVNSKFGQNFSTNMLDLLNGAHSQRASNEVSNAIDMIQKEISNVEDEMNDCLYQVKKSMSMIDDLKYNLKKL